MADYDVIIVGTGAGGGTLARHLAPSGKRILLLERGDWLPREPQNWLAQDVFVDNRYVSEDTWYDDQGKAFQPQIHYFVGGATKLYGAALYRLREEDFGELQHHDGVSPAWPITYDEIEPYYTKAEHLYEVHGAHGEDPTEPHASAPYPFPAVSHEPRIQQLSDDLAAAGYHPFHAPCGIRLNEAEHALQRVRALRELRRLPLRRARQVGRGRARRSARARAFERRAAHQRAGRQARDERRRHGGDRGGRRARRRAGDVLGRPRRARLRRGEHREAAARVRDRQAPARPRQRLRPGRPELHVPQQPGGARALAGREPDHLPEDARAERLLLRRSRDTTTRSATSRWSASRRRRCSTARSRSRRSSRRTGRWNRSPTTRSTSGSRPRTCRCPRTGHRRRRGQADPRLHGDERHAEEGALQAAALDARQAAHRARTASSTGSRT